MLKKLSILIVLTAALPAWGAEPVGEVVDFAGVVKITHERAVSSVSRLKQPIFVSDTIETKEPGAVKILFKDDTLLTVKENSKTLITEYLFDADAKHRKATFNVLFGKIRTVVGKFFGNEEPVEIRTPTAVAGIRGTDVGAVVKKKKSVFYCFDGLFNAYSSQFPDQVRSVTKGMFVEVAYGSPPSELMPIPEEIINNPEYFDIPLAKTSASTSSSSVTSSPSAASQTTQTSSVQTAKSTLETATPTAAINTSPSALDAVVNTSQDTSFSSDNNPAASSTTSTSVLPNASSETTNTTTITISIPSS